MSDERIDAPFPHCDSRVLHGPGKCHFCDMYPKLQQQRIDEGIAFTGESPQIARQNGRTKPCPAEAARPLDTIEKWYGNVPKTKEQLEEDHRRFKEELAKALGEHDDD